MKKTKIICSIGPASCAPDVMEKMVNAGMNVARINFSHATLEERKNVVESVKEVRKRTGANIAILYDTKGPEFRSGMLENGEINLIEGNLIRVVKEDILGTEEKITVNHPQVLDNLEVKDVILLENGLMKIEVISKEEDGVTCRIVNGGILGNKKSLSVPGKRLDIPYVSEKDKEDIIYACEHEPDYLAISFVSCKEEVEEVRAILKEHGQADLPIICKIENAMGIENLDEILEVSEGIMVARGDLGTETCMETLPLVQKDMIKKCREHGKIAIVATEMLESMKKNARPTRAEISDVANAVLDGADAVMLSGESTVGKYPAETVKFMADICEATENQADFTGKFNYKKYFGATQTISTCVVESSKLMNSKLIVAATVSGFTARKISNLKPKCLILATCPTEEIGRRLTLNWGVYPAIVPILGTTDEVISESIAKAKEFMPLEKGDTVIVTGGFPNTGVKKTTNLMKIEEI
jgi:pyruvate kinase